MDCMYITFEQVEVAALLKPTYFRGMAHRAEAAHSMGFQVFVPFCHWNWLLLLVVLKSSEATSVLNKSTNSTDIQFAAASTELDVKISIFTLDYEYVQTPYEVTLWILLASLAKIGKSSNTGLCKLFSI